MKRIILLFSLLLAFLPMWGQPDSVAIKLTDAQRDSVIVRTQRATSFLANNKMFVGRYKVYPTTNIYTSLKLDTVTGAVTALQIGLGDDMGFEYDVTGPVVSDEIFVGRFELYPTQNNYNFILLDTCHGYAYQVQWSVDSDKCMRVRLW